MDRAGGRFRSGRGHPGILTAVEPLHLALRYLHLVGFALLFGATIAQYLTGTLRINSVMLWGAGVQVLTGIALSAPLRGGGSHEPPVAKLAVKLVLGLAIFAMVFFSRKRQSVHRGHFLSIAGLALITAAVGTFWR